MAGTGTKIFRKKTRGKPIVKKPAVKAFPFGQLAEQASKAVSAGKFIEAGNIAQQFIKESGAKKPEQKKIFIGKVTNIFGNMAKKNQTAAINTALTAIDRNIRAKDERTARVLGSIAERLLFTQIKGQTNPAFEQQTRKLMSYYRSLNAKEAIKRLNTKLYGKEKVEYYG